MPEERLELARSNEVLAPERRVSIGALAEEARRVIAEGPAGLAVVARDAAVALGGAARLAVEGGAGVVLRPDVATPEVRDRLVREGLLPGAHAASPRGAGERIGIFTSGSTGPPKLVWHTWATLHTMRGVRDLPPRRWLLTYQPGTYAWWQVATLALFVEGQSVVTGDEPTVEALLLRAREEAATAISSTPTFWRMGMLTLDEAELRAIPFEQVTLGGEPVDQEILDRLGRLYPGARIHHIYASTEAGAAIVVRDGCEGFPLAWIEALGGGDPAARAHSSLSDAVPGASNRPRLRIAEGRLQVCSPWAAPGQHAWLDTGDRVEVRGDRVVVVGREATTFINVGGVKVDARKVEAVLAAHPAVQWCRVRAERSPLVGQLVAADIVSRAPAELAAELTAFAAARLPEAWVPRFIERLDAIPASENFKTG